MLPEKGTRGQIKFPTGGVGNGEGGAPKAGSSLFQNCVSRRLKTCLPDRFTRQGSPQGCLPPLLWPLRKGLCLEWGSGAGS